MMFSHVGCLVLSEWCFREETARSPQSDPIKSKVIEYGLVILNYLNKLHSKWTLVTQSIPPKYATNEKFLRLFEKLVFQERDFLK